MSVMLSIERNSATYANTDTVEVAFLAAVAQDAENGELATSQDSSLSINSVTNATSAERRIGAQARLHLGSQTTQAVNYAEDYVHELDNALEASSLNLYKSMFFDVIFDVQQESLAFSKASLDQSGLLNIFANELQKEHSTSHPVGFCVYISVLKLVAGKKGATSKYFSNADARLHAQFYLNQIPFW
eukprot:IDg18464t1